MITAATSRRAAQELAIETLAEPSGVQVAKLVTNMNAGKTFGKKSKEVTEACAALVRAPGGHKLKLEHDLAANGSRSISVTHIGFCRRAN